MAVLVDTSIWVDYFKAGNNSSNLDRLIDENILVTNDIILAELVSYLTLKKQAKVIELLGEINRVPLHINWGQIIEFQVKCLRNGANGIGIPDLIIAQNAKSNNLKIYTLDKHFQLLSQTINIKLY